jgi:hypothetical protein
VASQLAYVSVLVKVRVLISRTLSNKLKVQVQTEC